MSGFIPGPSASTGLMYGLAAADGTGALLNGHNVVSVTRNGIGDFDIVFLASLINGVTPTAFLTATNNSGVFVPVGAATQNIANGFNCRFFRSDTAAAIDPSVFWLLTIPI